MKPPKSFELIGSQLAIIWENSYESFYSSEYLRAHSPSAENVGEKDIFGNQYGGQQQKNFPGVTIRNWHFIGNYAVKFEFSDGHNTGIYSWHYLKSIDPNNK